MEKRTILVVDNEPEFTRALTGSLEARSYRVLIVASRAEAESLTTTQRPDAVVLGTIMPRGDAFLFHRWLKRMPTTADVPLMVLNAPLEKQLLCGWRRDEGMQCEAEDFVTKPVDVAALVGRVERLLQLASRTIRVLVADDHAVVRDGIRAVLTLERDIQVIGEAVNGREALEKTVELVPDVVLMDIVMPVMNGLEATKQLCQVCPMAKVLVLSQYDDEENILASSHAGARGFIPKTAASSQLLAGIRTVNQGKKFVHALPRQASTSSDD